MSHKNKFRVGTVVRLKLGKSSIPGRRKLTRIAKFYSNIPGGGVILEEELGRFRSWNVEDLERGPAPQPEERKP